MTHQNNHNQVSKVVNGEFFLINGPGEYEVKEVFVQGIASEKEKGINTIYTIETEDLKICHLGCLNQKELTDEQLDKIGEVDILMIPVGDGEVISAKEAVKIMSQIEPQIILPMYYHLPKLKIKLDGVDKFLKMIGVKKIEPLPKLNIKKKDISADEVKIILLSV
jgi:L-ascorbate metabolism protein UlaG (beta-lactamase superfamily)